MNNDSDQNDHSDAIGSLTQQIIERHALTTIDDVLAMMPTRMCHVTQEPDVFHTYMPGIVRLSYPRDEWAKHDAVYAHYRDDVIASLSLTDYLRAFLDDPDAPRLPCFCSEMSDVAGAIVSSLLDQPVYAIRQIYVNYLYLPQRWHCINALVERGRSSARIRYFDASAYAQVFDPSRRKFMRPEALQGFDYADIEPRFVVSERWLQSEPVQRAITLDGDTIRDSFTPQPTVNATRKPATDDYLRVYAPAPHFAHSG
ncbi:hypothetical protein [Paraburkholderia sp.]|uniref:hypothetical protein n=1 Tax=Paraburkholderia sp. TaxID=1926495 RepID=UPI00239907FA|nr:hypothetical protein [Paraburkholderia sp.]MDE1180640.1 hypothetical protein [Paraburkholderia sp.]